MTDKATRVFIVYTCMTALTEVVASVAGHFWGSNMAVYAVYEVIEILCIGWYYNGLVHAFRKWNLGIIAGIVGAIVAIGNMVWLESPAGPDSNFSVEGVAVIVVALYYCLQWVADYDGRTSKDEHHLWFSVILAGYSSVTFFGYGLYSYLADELKDDLNIYHNCLVTFNILVYGAIGYLFYMSGKVRAENG
jgi:hypothetical protein